MVSPKDVAFQFLHNISSPVFSKRSGINRNDVHFRFLIGKLFFGRDDAIALVYGSVMRNLSIALAIAMTVFGKKGSDIALIIAMAYIIQVQSAAWYVKFTARIFGKAPEDTARDIMSKGLFSLHGYCNIARRNKAAR